LGECDATKVNPYYRSRAPMRLYLRSRVVEAEATDAFVQAKADKDRRSAAATRTAERRRQATIDHAGTVRFVVPVVERERLIAEACRAYNLLWAERGQSWKRAPPAD